MLYCIFVLSTVGLAQSNELKIEMIEPFDQLLGGLETTNELVGGLRTTNQLVGGLETANQLVGGLQTTNHGAQIPPW